MEEENFGNDSQKMLDTTKNLGEQSEYVKKAIEPLFTWKWPYTKEVMDIGHYSGNDDYKNFWETKNKEDPDYIKDYIFKEFSVGDMIDKLSGYDDDNKKATFEKLKSIGIEGIHYGFYNVVFNDEYLKSLDRENMDDYFNEIYEDDAELQDLPETELTITSNPSSVSDSQINTARKAGYVQGVCECVAVVGDDHALGKKLLSIMQVTKDMAKKYANPETYKNLVQGIFAQKQEQNIERSQGMKR